MAMHSCRRGLLQPQKKTPNEHDLKVTFASPLTDQKRFDFGRIVDLRANEIRAFVQIISLRGNVTLQASLWQQPDVPIISGTLATFPALT